MGTKAGIFQIDDFGGGLITKASLIKLKPNQTPKCMNVYSHAFGTLKKRLGYTKLGATTSAVCNGLFGFIKDASNKYLVGYWATGLKKMDAGATGWDGTWDSVTLDAAQTDDQMHFDVFKKAGVGTLILTTEAQDLMQAWDGGTDTTTLYAAPKAKYIKVWNNHVWAANCVDFITLESCDTPWDYDTEVIDDCEDTWDEKDVSDVTQTIDSTDYKVGTQCVKIIIADAFTTGIAATETISSADYDDYKYVNLWIKSSTTTSAGDLQFMIDDSAECASPIETINIPILTANVWAQVQLTLGTPANFTSCISIGLNVAVDSGSAQTVWIDDVRAVKTAKQYIYPSCDETNKQMGDNCIVTGIAAGHTTGIIAIKTLDITYDLKDYDTMTFLARSTYNSSGDADSGIQILLDDTEECSNTTTKEAITIPKMAANTWTYHSVSLANPSTDTSIKSMGLKIATDKAAQTIHIDEIRVTKTEPDQLRRSALAEFDDWTGTDAGYENIFTAQDVGLTGMAELEGRFYVFKKKSIHRITYLGGRPLLDIKQAKSAVGTISPRTIVHVDVPGGDVAGGAKLIFLGSDRQLYLFNGYTTDPISDPIQTDNGESAVFMNDITSDTGVNAALGMCHAINIPDKHWYVLFVPIGSAATACTHVIVYDYLAKAFWSFDTQAFTQSWYGDDGDTAGGSDAPYAAKTNYSYKWWSGNDDDSASIASSWESPKLSMGKKGRPMLKKCRYVEGNSAVNGTVAFTFSYRNDWTSSYTASSTAVVQSANQWTRTVSQIGNLLQVKLNDSNTSAPYEIYSLDFVGEEKTIGR